MNKNLYLIIRREYLERVRRKSFILTTVLMPLFMIGLMAMPALIMLFSSPEEKTIAVIDESSMIAPKLQSDDALKFMTVDISADSAKRDETYEAVLVIGPRIIDNPADVRFYSRESSSMQTEENIRSQIGRIIENYRLLRYNIPDLDQILADVHADVRMQSFKIGADDERETSAVTSYIMGMVMMMMLYMFIMMYGNMVMSSIIEEKTNRVLEVVVSSTKASHLMLGKILGIGAVALTQIAIWAALIFGFSQLALPAMMGGASAVGGDTDMLAIVNTLGDAGYIMGLFGWLALFLLGGFLFYSALYAAIGSAVDNIQDASQLTTIAVVPVILGMMVSFAVINDPNSTLAFWASLIPFTSPMVVMARLPFGVPLWQLLLSLVILAVSVWFMVWLSAKIYRVGIFMYGKKPTVKDLIRWARYK